MCFLLFFVIICRMNNDTRTVEWDVLVVGGGHAGIEATLASARIGCKTLLITGKFSSIGMMPCNPSIGGLAKSHLVCELDALGGEMGLATDCCGIQFKTLNISRGPAVWATRVQCDKKQYAKWMQGVVTTTKNVTVVEDTVTDVLIENNTVIGVRTKTHGDFSSRAVVLTTGTALHGLEFIGHEGVPGGGDGRPPATELSKSLQSAGFNLIRLKTGTPPRLYRKSIDFSKTVEQPGDFPPPFFSLLTKMFHVEHFDGEIAIQTDNCSTWNIPKTFNISPDGKGQLSCYQTHTNEHTHQIIRDHLKDSALYGGDIIGTGVRYCPSIEDKIVKFKGVPQHHVMLEPEGRAEEDYIYPNGLSNSFPRNVQDELVHSVAGLEHAEFAKYAYAIEYDGIDSRELNHAFESKRISGLFFGGQVNGTTGYEEAAAQGFIAGVNAALKVQKREPLVFSRQQAYIGVLVDDLVTKGTNEPYRMFTSRAERRLLLRQDNARYRLLEAADRLGIADARIRAQSHFFEQKLKETLDTLDTVRFENQSLSSILARPR